MQIQTIDIPANTPLREAAAIAIADYHRQLRRLIGDTSGYTRFEISGLEIVATDSEGTEHVHRCVDEIADFWSVYGVLPDGTAEPLIDCDERIDAQDYLAALTEHGVSPAPASVSAPLLPLGESVANPCSPEQAAGSSLLLVST